MGLMGEFREFAVKGNMVDMAVGIVIGGAFGKIVSSLVDKVIMPPLGLLIGGMDFGELGTELKAAEGETPAVVLGWGAFVQAAVDFLIIAAVLFVVVKGINQLRRKEVAAPSVPPAPPPDVALLTEIRDLLAKR